ncbi:hypothetical protein D3C87_1559130 [compost metagenome]
MLDALGVVPVDLFEIGDEARFGLAVEGVEDLGHLLVAVAALGVVERRHELGAQGHLDLFEDFLLHRIEAQHALHHVHGQFLGQHGENLGGMLGGDLGEHHGNGLGIFVLEIGGEHVGLHVGELLPHVAAGRPADFFHDGVHLVGGQETQQQPLGGVGIA